jgi:kynurenine formamidase
VRVDRQLARITAGRMTRREMFRLAGLAGAAGALTSLAKAPPAPAAPGAGPRFVPPTNVPINDEMFDVAAVEGGAWVPGPYGPGDQRGSFNEVTAEKTAAALALLDLRRPVKTYNLGELVFNGFPAFTHPALPPPRSYEQRLTVMGYQAPPGFGGIQQVPVPQGPNRISAHEDRFTTTYHIATQIDGLGHVGVGAMFYNGFQGRDLADTHGLKFLGNENMGPIVTRGVVIDVIGLKLVQGAINTYFKAADGHSVLRETYRITVGDIEEAMARQGIREITPGDVVLFHTGWSHLVRSEPKRYAEVEPGIYLSEARYLARFRPAIIGGDTWGLEIVDPNVTQGNLFPVHQELFMRHGIRIGEAILTESLVNDGISEFVFLVTPQNALGATGGNTPPAALAQP